MTLLAGWKEEHPVHKNAVPKVQLLEKVEETEKKMATEVHHENSK